MQWEKWRDGANHAAGNANGAKALKVPAKFKHGKISKNSGACSGPTSRGGPQTAADANEGASPGKCQHKALKAGPNRREGRFDHAGQGCQAVS